MLRCRKIAWLSCFQFIQNTQEKSKEKNHILFVEKIVDEKQIRPTSLEAWILRIRNWWCETILWTKIQQKHSQQQTTCSCNEMTGERETRTKRKSRWKSIAETSRKTSKRIASSTWRTYEMKESDSVIVAETSCTICSSEQKRQKSEHRCSRRRKNSENVQNRIVRTRNDLSKLQYECKQSWMTDWRRIRSTWYSVQHKFEESQIMCSNLMFAKFVPEEKWKLQHIDIYSKQIFNEQRRSNMNFQKKPVVEKSVLHDEFFWFLSFLFSWILHIRNTEMFAWYIHSTWRMKECVHWMIQMIRKNNNCTDVRFSMYSVQEKKKHNAIRTNNRECRRKFDVRCEFIHLRHRRRWTFHSWFLTFVLPRIRNQMMTKENQAYW